MKIIFVIVAKIKIEIWNIAKINKENFHSDFMVVFL